MRGFGVLGSNHNVFLGCSSFSYVLYKCLTVDGNSDADTVLVDEPAPVQSDSSAMYRLMVRVTSRLVVNSDH
jgi:hypothetical protein